jgi:hypothetical protein
LPTLAWWVLSRLRPQLKARPGQGEEKERSGGRVGLLYKVRSVLLAWDRCALARRLERLTARGCLVVCDRYPSAQVGAADSARLEVPAAGRAGVSLEGLEQSLYARIAPPAVVVRVAAPLDVAIVRNRERDKPGKESDAYVTSRHRHFVAPAFPGSRMIVIDTNRPRPVTALALRRALWEALGT